MDDKELEFERAKLSIEMAKIHEDGVKSRREYEWKLALGSWAGIGALTAFVLHEGIRLTTLHLTFLGIAYALLFVVSVVCWIKPLADGHAADRNFKHYFMDIAAGEQRERLTEKKKWKWSTNTHLWFWGQVLFTFILLLLSYGAIKTGRPSEKSASEDRKSGSITQIQPGISRTAAPDGPSNKTSADKIRAADETK